MKTVILLSGGLDSSTLLYHLLSGGDIVKALTIDYGQRHAKEIEAARTVAKEAGVEHKVVNLSEFASLCGGSALTDNSIAVPHGHYTDISMKSTVVPNRNMVFISLAAAWSLALGFESVSYAAHAGDHTIYPDCRKEFTDALDGALKLCDWNPMTLNRPFVQYSKGDICKRGAELFVPFNLTWSCYEGGERHCGRCGTCVERREAFKDASVPDPTIYAEG